MRLEICKGLRLKRSWRRNGLGLQGCRNDLWVPLFVLLVGLVNIRGVAVSSEYSPDKSFRVENRHGGPTSFQRLMVVVIAASLLKLPKHQE